MATTRCSVLFGNDPQAYRQTLAAVVEAVYQGVEVIVVAPEELDERVRRDSVSLVICSRLTEVIAATGTNWVLLHPDGDRRVEVGRGGEHSCHDAFELDDLLAVIDGVVASLDGTTLAGC